RPQHGLAAQTQLSGLQEAGERLTPITPSDILAALFPEECACSSLCLSLVITICSSRRLVAQSSRCLSALGIRLNFAAPRPAAGRCTTTPATSASLSHCCADSWRRFATRRSSVFPPVRALP